MALFRRLTIFMVLLRLAIIIKSILLSSTDFKGTALVRILAFDCRARGNATLAVYSPRSFGMCQTLQRCHGVAVRRQSDA